MDNGIYVAASSMLAEQDATQVVGENLGNIDTPGYKRSNAELGSFGDLLLSNMADGSLVGPESAGVEMKSATVDLNQGTLQVTGRQLDVAFNGPGFIAVQGANGAVDYSRGGSLALDSQGDLTLADGTKLLGTNGKPIHLTSSTPAISVSGAITVAGVPVGQLRMVDLTNAQKTGAGLFSGTVTGAATGQLQQGYLEASNVDPSQEMTELIDRSSTFQASAQILDAINSTLEKATSDVGNPSA